MGGLRSIITEPISFVHYPQSPVKFVLVHAEHPYRMGRALCGRHVFWPARGLDMTNDRSKVTCPECQRRTFPR